MRRALSRKNLWDAMLPAVGPLVGVLCRPIPPAWFLGRTFRRELRFVRAADRWSAERIRDHQFGRLRHILRLAHERTPYYRESFQAAGFHPRDLREPADLHKLPTIDKRTLRDHLDRMCAVSPKSWRVDYVSTGGSQGTPLCFYIRTDRSAIEYGHLTACWERIGYRIGQPLAVFRGRVIRARAGRMPYVHDPILRHHCYSTFHMTDENMRRYLDHVRTLGPCFLHVYPSAAAMLARFIQRSGIEPPDNVQGIIAESEMVYPHQRRLVEQVFGRRYFSCYGHSEKLVLAAECERSNDYHVVPTYGYAELLDESGMPVTTPGRRGEIVGTGFINDVVPFIRYRTGDHAEYVADRCAACGRNHMILRDVSGHRIQEMLVATDGSLISWTAVNVHDDTFSGVRQFQFYQDTPGRATLRVAPANGYSETDRRKILQGLEAKLRGRIRIDIELCDQVYVSPRGKAVYVDQRTPGVEFVGASETHLVSCQNLVTLDK